MLSIQQVPSTFVGMLSAQKMILDKSCLSEFFFSYKSLESITRTG